MTDSLQPDHEYGYTEAYLKEKMGPVMFSNFRVWMYGQTVALDGEITVYYRQDVDRFLSGGRVID